MQQASLFHEPADVTRWHAPETLPDLSQVAALGLDTESDGLDLWGRSKPIGLSVAGPGFKHYLPWGHAGGNLDEQVVKRWACRELRNKKVMIHDLLDLHLLRKWGVDLEAQGCEPHNVCHQVVLLDEKRRGLSLDELGHDFLSRRKQVLPFDKSTMAQHHAALVGPYAETDAELTWELWQRFRPEIESQDLVAVEQLESDIIWAICEMERNGALLDVEKLVRWERQAGERWQQCILEIHKLTGLRVIPTKPDDLAKLFNHLKLPYGLTATEQPSFTEHTLKVQKHPAVQLALEARQLDGLKSKYLTKYRRAVGPGGILRYKLHQLRNDDYGTVTGRFSSSSVNIQQVYSPDMQRNLGFTQDYLIRELFIPAPGKVWAKADASQIEFRNFAHYSNSKRLIAEYQNNPEADFHQLVADMCHLRRYDAKHINFGRVFGMGRDKMYAQMQEYNPGITRVETDQMFDQYDQEFPETRQLMNTAMRLAKDRGYVKTILGRRRRYPDGQRLHSALNAVIQGSAADLLKLALLDLYKERKRLGLTLRFTVHDEFDGDLEDPAMLGLMADLLNKQRFDLRVPISWELKVAKDWGHA